MLFFNSKVLLYVRKNKLVVFLNGKQTQVEFPPKIFQNLEILDSAGFEKLVGDFLAGLKLGKKSAIIALSDEITFHKSVSGEEMQAFLDSVPFDPGNLASKKIQSGGKTLIYAANKEIYETLLRVAENLEWKIAGVIPAPEDVSDSGAAKKILSDKKLIALSDFLNDNDGEVRESSGSGGKIITIVLIILVLGGTAAALLYFRSIKTLPFFGKVEEKKISETVENKTATSSVNETSTSSASLQGETLERREITAQVLNGSGVSGQAAKVRDILVELGYSEENTELGNATGSGETVVIFSKKVPQEIKDEIISELEKIFEDVTTQEDTEDIEFDILIITGKGV